ncbi:vesicle-associated protein 1-3-like [Salvia splendens]|uniref:vesicle-associated protein 1-3-like n=1 Tax=Salvia splendens TaxID=180675 RepID=UPI001C2624A5|nr:vesicle-associated protein 1-3-like [Salvia splendens]
MSSEPLLNYEPPELNFQFDHNKQLSSSVRLLNKTDDCVAFKLKSTNPRNYVVQPRIGVLLPRSSCEIKVKMRAQRESHHNIRCKDKFMIESVAASPDTTLEDARKLFDKESGNPLQEFILRANYSRPAESSPGTSVIENTDVPSPEVNDTFAEPHENSLQVASSVTDSNDNDLLVTNSVNEPRGNDSQEKDITRSGESILRSFISNCTGESILRDIISSLLIVVSLYLMKQTISWIWSLVMFVMMLIIKMIKKLVSDSVEDWIVKTLLHIVMYILFGNTGLT